MNIPTAARQSRRERQEGIKYTEEKINGFFLSKEHHKREWIFCGVFFLYWIKIAERKGIIYVADEP